MSTKIEYVDPSYFDELREYRHAENQNTLNARQEEIDKENRNIGQPDSLNRKNGKPGSLNRKYKEPVSTRIVPDIPDITISHHYSVFPDDLEPDKPKITVLNYRPSSPVKTKKVPTLKENEVPTLKENEVPTLKENEVPTLKENEVPTLKENEVPTLAKLVEKWKNRRLYKGGRKSKKNRRRGSRRRVRSSRRR
jgi:hypothetical protein